MAEYVIPAVKLQDVTLFFSISRLIGFSEFSKQKLNESSLLCHVFDELQL